MKLITDSLLNNVSGQAKENPRLRMNYNFHESMDAPIHRMLNALEPDTYLPPHRHKNPDKEEIYIVLRGSLLAILFDEEGNVTDKVRNPEEVPQPHPALCFRGSGCGRRWRPMTAKCVGCGLDWNVSVYQKIPRTGYICPHCESRLRAGETLPNIQASQKARPQRTKGATP